MQIGGLYICRDGRAADELGGTEFQKDGFHVRKDAMFQDAACSRTGRRRYSASVAPSPHTAAKLIQ